MLHAHYKPSLEYEEHFSEMRNPHLLLAGQARTSLQCFSVIVTRETVKTARTLVRVYALTTCAACKYDRSQYEWGP